MTRRIIIPLLFVTTMLFTALLQAAPSVFSFAVIGQNASKDDSVLQDSIKRAGQSKSSFIVINGLRSYQESCSDSAFQRRGKLLEDHEKPVFVSLAARDWAECQNENSESIAQERLNFLRGMLFENDPASRIKNIQITRQSSAAKFRNYAENARWESNGILFATINLPAGNNHYLAAAGRNNEFEDRLVANRVWLQRIFTYAKTHKIKGIVLFSDGNPMVVPAKSSRNETRDGFLEVRKQLTSLGARYAGKILLIHGQPSSGNITWRENIGTVGAGKFTLDITAKPGTTVLYSISRIGSASAKNNSSAKK